MAEKKIIAKWEELEDINAEFLRIKRRLCKKGGSSHSPEIVLRQLQEIAKKKENRVLRVLSENEELSVDACDGTKFLANDNNTLLINSLSLDPKSDTACPHKATKKVLVDVCELIKSSTLLQAYYSLAREDLDILCFETEHQVLMFYQKYPEWLCQGGEPTLATFFLLKCEGNPHAIIRIFARAGGLTASPDRFVGKAKTLVWPAGIRLVVPRLDSN